MLKSYSVSSVKKMSQYIKKNFDSPTVEKFSELYLLSKTVEEDIKGEYLITFLRAMIGEFYIFRLIRETTLLKKSVKRLEGQQKSFSKKRDGQKISRNAPCFCGSGKKYKKCCLLALS